MHGLQKRWRNGRSARSGTGKKPAVAKFQVMTEDALGRLFLHGIGVKMVERPEREDRNGGANTESRMVECGFAVFGVTEK
ncbi:hypothetical protein F511_25674 [Dorcoceras hygrometricum]|uniref:Uncharacterized protein n=1 Tax=Dorcoceras hygrometricum TaxID=472368 RepID=A0A2Z7AHM2_9LAMI|nr:hypothetical protein F511_25674 [Dorcoceras hygrometricum]